MKILHYGIPFILCGLGMKSLRKAKVTVYVNNTYLSALIDTGSRPTDSYID